ncbi:CPBP family intramembrane metalloprotease [Microbacterium lushaniae]|uniref:CPBP family intramembrane metalloprotease n=2 Tax=Microbacterium lushaniae TaxID=2614639 RepID=A0A5J6L720_9MICO|nr:CPBP family intramembrane metalloprotease [Microbacterium lushaniae]
MTRVTMQKNPASTRRAATLRGQLLFFALACAVISGGFWMALPLVGGAVTTSPGIWLYSLGACGPSLAALLAVLLLSRGDVPRRRIRRPWVWVPAALVLGALPAVVSAVIVSGGRLGAHAGETITSMGGLLPFIAIFLLTGPIAEEFGWRGYVQPRLRMRLGVLPTAAVLGATWAVWHLPLFLLAGTGQHAMGLFTPRAGVYLLTMVPLSVLFLFVSEWLSGGVWAAIVLHFAGNATGALLPQANLAGGLAQLGVVVALACGCLWAWRRIPPRSATRSTDSHFVPVGG